MSVEPTKPVEQTPAVEPKTDLPSTDPIAAPKHAGETPMHTPLEHPTQAHVPADEPAVASEAAAPTSDETANRRGSLVTATPAAEGVLGYKEPGFFKQLRYAKHHFWFGSDEASTHESLATYLRSEKSTSAHEHAAWAKETGKGLLFYAKRFEDKAAPAGIITLYDASEVATEGPVEFSFKAGTHLHRFQAASTEERDSWIVAIKTRVDESSAQKDEITGRETYKKSLTDYAKPAAGAGVIKTGRSKSKEPKKDLDAATATNNTTSTTTTPAAAPAIAPIADNASSSSSSDEDKKKAKKEKERSQSRKRQSIFGALLGKKEEKDTQKEVKKEEKEEHKTLKKAEKDEIKHEKKLEAEHKKEEAKAEHDSHKAVEAAEAAGLAAVPAAALAAEKKHEEKADDKTAENVAAEKKAKRASVFGSLFQKKTVTSPTTEKTEKDLEPIVPLKEGETAPVSETAPQVPPPSGAAPIDTAAVTAPTGTGSSALVNEPAKDTTPVPASTSTPATETATSPKTEKKSFMSFIKKNEPKTETKKDETTKPLPAEPTAAATTDAPTTTEPAAAVTSPVTSPTADPTEKNVRRSSFFGFAGLKKKSENPESEEPTGTSAKRDKSPLPGALGGLSRKFSKAKTDKPKETTDATPAVASVPESTSEGPVVAVAHPSTTSNTTTDITEPAGESSAAAGATALLPDTPAHEATTIAPEVKTTA